MTVKVVKMVKSVKAVVVNVTSLHVVRHPEAHAEGSHVSNVGSLLPSG